MAGYQPGKEKYVKTAPKNADKELLQDFLNYYGALKQLSVGSLKKHRYALTQMLGLVAEQGSTLTALGEKEALKITVKLRESPWSESTREDYWQRFCTIYKWAWKKKGPFDKATYEILCGEDRFIYKKDENKMQKKAIFTREEMLKLIHTESSLCYKVLYSILFEGGLRPCELLSLQVRDVETNPDGTYTLHLRVSKTERRPIELVNFSNNYLRKWLAIHPSKEDAPLFLNTQGKPVTYYAMRKHLKHLVKEAGLSREKVTPYSLRHSRATEVSDGILNEFQMDRLFGWKIGSQMPATYIREKNIDVKRALKKGYGLEEQETPRIQGKACLQCEHLNPIQAEHCDNCNLPLSEVELRKIKTNLEASKMEELLKKMLRETKGDLIKEVVAEVKGGGVQ